MRFYSALPAVQSDVRWYFADSGARALPYYNRFASRNWSYPEKGADTLGEVFGASRVWSNGADTDHYSGRVSCTTEVMWRDGVPVPVPPIDWDECCGKYRGRARLGLVGESTSDRGGASRVGRGRLALRGSVVINPAPARLGTAALGVRALSLTLPPPVYYGIIPLGLFALDVTGRADALGLIGLSSVAPPLDLLGETYLGLRGSSRSSPVIRLGLRASGYSLYNNGVVCWTVTGDWWDTSIPGASTRPQHREVEGSILDTWTIHYFIDVDAIPPYNVIIGQMRNGAFWGQLIGRYNAVGIIGFAVTQGSECGDSPDYTVNLQLGMRGLGSVSFTPDYAGSAGFGVRGSAVLALPPSVSSSTRAGVRGSSTLVSGGSSKSGSIQAGLRGSGTATPVVVAGYVQGTTATAFAGSVSATLSGTVSGNVVLAHLAIGATGVTITTPTGWTAVSTVDSGFASGTLKTYRITSTGGTLSPNFAISGGSQNLSLILTEWGGVTGATYGSGTGSSFGNTITTANITSAHAGDILVACPMTSATTNTFSSLTSGWTQNKNVNNASGPCACVCSRAPATGTYALTVTASNSMANGTASSILALTVP